MNAVLQSFMLFYEKIQKLDVERAQLDRIKDLTEK